ncbi:vesicle-associated protein 2-2-like isoform X1 [Prosopis cineraria]|uniref:vesicle-associated protein 2-2-like isoform X1 n=1 Tax=Prosopis cineraria TaxID=364024 RepID=UPI00240F5255|nr:vesicle-associated protein 2-2-like isoform X1 [Prosopis cineraria]
MNNQLLEIEPKELKFLFQFKKQSSCSIQLTNITKYHVAFKVKTTAPKKYSVRPNVGVLLPNSACDFIAVTMQALKEAPADMACKDKFLIQSTIVPVGTTNEDITSSLFVKDDNKYVEENKLKVALISLTSSPELSPINGDFNNGLAYEKNQIFGTEEILSQEPMNVEHRMVNEESNDENDIELNVEEDERSKIMTDVEVLKPGTAELKVSKDVELNNVKDAQASNAEKVAMLNVSKSAEEIKLMEAIEEIKLKLDKLESKLNEAGVTISKLTEESRLSNLETKVMQEKIADLSKRGSQKIQVGFPLLYVCMVALISLLLGYRSHS